MKPVLLHFADLNYQLKKCQSLSRAGLNMTSLGSLAILNENALMKQREECSFLERFFKIYLFIWTLFAG